MEEILNTWAVWYVTQDNKLCNIDYIGQLEGCVNFVRRYYFLRYAVLPYDPAKL